VSANESEAKAAVRPAIIVSYERVLQILGSAWFFVLALVVAGGVSVSPHLPWVSRASSCLLAIYFILAAFLMLTRPPARAKAETLLPRLAGFVGTYMIWTISFFDKNDAPALNLASSVLILLGTVMMLVTLRHLGKAFSLTPQARHVVKTGPYRWVRHPLYLWEEIVVVGVVLQYLSIATVVIFLVNIAVQVCRIHYEEDLLRRTCPDYAGYAASRWRLIPHVW
jgi:protein-S-isoprenylcysteine O-methyltransferase Ste14